MSARVIGANAVFGLLLGFSLSHIGFGDFGEVHRMFTFADLRLVLTFGGAVALCAAGFALVTRRWRFVPRPAQAASAVGGVVFGLGWALSGACPGIVLVQLGEGRLMAGLTLGGIISGTWLFGLAQRRFGIGAVESC
ncbi:MAG TPA: YeeE/YedE thiosulfate transporter family protein [Myxococcaceae bacterium]|nr:YeeE/YedE thiosulfate transporter family protein [Myxococcaceae bacterium]